MEEKRATWLELFYDLVYVAAIATATHVLLHTHHGVIPFEYASKFVLMFIPIWWAWVGQTMFINRFFEDAVHQRLFVIGQMVFVLIMTASLNVDFDDYYYSFLIGYLGLRVMTVLQYTMVNRRIQDPAARFLGTYLWIGIGVSALSLFFDGSFRYVVLYLGIIIDLVVPIIGRKRLAMTPIHLGYLLERFGLLTIIVLGESIISILAVLEPQDGDIRSISFSILAFIVLIAIWWQYFDNIEKKVDKEAVGTGQIILYGHLFIWMSLSVLASMMKLMYLGELNERFEVIVTFGAVLVYFLSTTLVFHNHRFPESRLHWGYFVFFVALILVFTVIHLFVLVSPLVIMIELAIFFAVYAKLTTT
ncbi:low temperature requirement protein A [Exiguobacterium aestuarii]|uniref:low temperature requirement protein A n=1 Tax=Exiguobacterium aestuarii TaxID=273527 RepID=UPI001CD4B682|nr:low temperature requirement protein A [Exiguobacterium aestuarii]MCA0981056.1 low temperature requirement protein A [Exiguobacterium aestuarii]